MHKDWYLQIGLTLALGALVLRWSWGGFAKNHFGLRVATSWTALGLSFPTAAILNRLYGDELGRFGVSATGVLLAAFAAATLLTLAATTDEASTTSKVAEAALLEAVFVRDLAGFRAHLSKNFPSAHLPGIVVVPALNEEASITGVVDDAVNVLRWPVVVVDDGSTDATCKRARSSGAFVSTLPQNLGVGAALRLGLRFADALGIDHVLQLDGDGQHPASQALLLMDRATLMTETASSFLIVGSRFGEKSTIGLYPMGRVRRIAIKLLARRIRRVSPVALSDPSSGFRLFVGQPLVSFASMVMPTEYLGDTFGFLRLAFKAKFSVTEVDVSMLPRQGGQASSSGLSNVRFLLRVLLQS